MKRRTFAALMAGVAVAATMASGALAQDKPTMGVVVKIGGIPWFNAMEMGITEKGAELARTSGACNRGPDRQGRGRDRRGAE